MALTPLRLPRLQQGLAIVDPKTGRPSAAFVRYWNVELLAAIERSVNDLAQVQADLAAVIADVVDVQADLVAAQAQLAAQVTQIQSLLGIAQGAQQAANDAQTTADEALATGTVSGSNMDPSVDVPGAGWVQGPVVSLTGVVAGTLTIAGTGPIQDGDVTIDGAGTAAPGEFRVVEIDGVTETVLFTGTFSAFQSGGDPVATITNSDATAVSAYSAALTTTGALDYRIDARCTLGGLTSLKLYIYARREA